MTTFEKRMLAVLGMLILALAVMESMIPRPVDWSASFSRLHDKPYGGKLLYDRLGDLFPHVVPVHDPPYTIAYERSDATERVNHLYVNSAFELDDLNAEWLLEMVAEGDHAFIAAEHFFGKLADTLNVEVDFGEWTSSSDTVDIRFIGDQRILPGVFRYSRGFNKIHFSSYDTSRTRVLAVDGSSRPVLLEMAWGEGRIILSSTPLAFTNYNLLKEGNAEFIAGAFSTLPYQEVYWDEFHKVGRLGSNSLLRYILSQPPLRWAWYMTLVLILLYMITHARRHQRAIPVIRPLRNATRELAHTIGRLYWHKGDHAALARRMVAHFKEDVRARTYLRTFNYDRDTMGHLAAKTGLDFEEIERRLHAIRICEGAVHISEQELLQLEKELHEFREAIR